MAELTPQTGSQTRWSAAQTRSQFAAIAWLRWRITLNSFRRKGGAGELISRIVISLIFASITVFLVVGAGIVAYFFASHAHLNRIAWMLWAIFILCQLLNIQLGQPGTTFDPTQLIRFPLRVDTYTSIRLFFGLLTPANIVGTLMSFAVAVGIAIATPALWLYALLALAIFAAANVLFSRMVFAWVDRWLSTRRAREVFTGLIFAFSLAIQWANFTFNPAYDHNHAHHTHSLSQQHLSQQQLSQQHLSFVTTLYHRAQPVLAVLPPELTTSSLLAAHRAAIVSFFAYSLACALFAALFLAVFALRMKTEFRGENLSDAASGVSRKALKPSSASTASTASTAKLASAAVAPAAIPSASTSTFSLPPVIVATLGKEILYVRRHMGILYGLIMPIFLVLIFASKFASRSNSFWVFPTAIAYTLLAICPLSYNSFGFEAAGSQFYFLAPVRMRDILLAKNLFNFLMAFIEILAIFAIISYMVGRPSLKIALATLLWAAGTLAINAIVGNRRSIASPKKINPQRAARRQASQASTFLSLAVLTISTAIGAGLFSLCIWFHLHWAMVPLFALFAAIGIVIYMQSLSSLDKFALDHREELFTELCKQT